MFIIFGTKVTEKNVGTFQIGCGVCRREDVLDVVKVTTWFSLFFIPTIPIKRRYYLKCPICGNYFEGIKKDEHGNFEYITEDQ
ncbi:hypothetical protein FACS1894122_10100 [Alphaproteobacteria bacterium]|nr:hypothetical protein FACS1894122_10100 [Alphaproteobacteria bacterium]